MKTYEIREQITPENWRQWKGYAVDDSDDTVFTLLDICTDGGFWVHLGGRGILQLQRPLYAVRQIDPRRETWDGQTLPEGVEPFSDKCLFLGKGGAGTIAHRVCYGRSWARHECMQEWRAGAHGFEITKLYALDLSEPEAVAAFRRVMAEDGKGELAEQILACYELPEAKLEEPKRTPREVLEAWRPECENGKRARAAALRQCDEAFVLYKEPYETFDDTLFFFADWSCTIEGDEYWRSVHHAVKNNTPIPDYPDIYQHTKDGEPITIPPELADEWEIVPEGEKLPEDGCPYYSENEVRWKAFPYGSTDKVTGEDGFAHLAGTNNFIRAYARRKVKREEAKEGDAKAFEDFQKVSLAFNTLTEDDAEALRIGRAVLELVRRGMEGGEG